MYMYEVFTLDSSFVALVAEVIHHFCPQICNPRSYYKWNSRINKLSNWAALNSKGNLRIKT